MGPRNGQARHAGFRSSHDKWPPTYNSPCGANDPGVELLGRRAERVHGEVGDRLELRKRECHAAREVDTRTGQHHRRADLGGRGEAVLGVAVHEHHGLGVQESVAGRWQGLCHSHRRAGTVPGRARCHLPARRTACASSRVSCCASRDCCPSRYSECRQ